MTNFNAGGWEGQWLGHGYGDLRGISDRDWSQGWGSTHGMDQYGGITGPGGRVPHPIALDVQATHERAVWNARNRLGASALHFGMGALGNLQSFRPGGGAAEQAGVFQQLSGIQLNRASMLQPLDLLGDLRRHEAHQARKAAKKAGTISAITGLVAAAASAATGNPAGAAAGLQMAGQGFAASQGGGPTGTAPPGQSAGFGGSPNMLQGGGANPNAYGQPAQGNPLMSMGGGQPRQPGAGPGLPGGGGGGAPMQSSGGPMTPGSSPGGSSGGPPSGGGQRAGGPGGPGGGGPAGGGGAMGMMGPPPVGMNGDFSPVAWASTATQSAAANPVAQLAEIKFKRHVADMLEHDPAWDWIDAGIARQAMLRGRAA